MSSSLSTSNNTRFQNLLAAASPSTSASSSFPIKSLLFKPASSFGSIAAVSSSYSSVTVPPSTMGDATMDAVQKRLMFEDEFVPNPFFLIDTTFFLIILTKFWSWTWGFRWNSFSVRALNIPSGIYLFSIQYYLVQFIL